MKRSIVTLMPALAAAWLVAAAPAGAQAPPPLGPALEPAPGAMFRAGPDHLGCYASPPVAAVFERIARGTRAT
jgi:hypothetical protein